MTELLAALPSLFSFQHRDDYTAFVRDAQADLIAQRAVNKTARQMVSALQIVVRNGSAGQDHSHSGADN
jgi:hypothetical protein